MTKKQKLIKQGYIIYKDNLTSKEFATLKAKEMHSIGYKTEVAETQDGFYAVLVIERSQATQNANGLNRYKAKLQFIKENNIPLLKDQNGKPMLKESDLDKAIAKFKATV